MILQNPHMTNVHYHEEDICYEESKLIEKVVYCDSGKWFAIRLKDFPAPFFAVIVLGSEYYFSDNRSFS